MTSEETQAVLDQEHLRLLVPQQARGNVNDAFAQQSMQMMFALFGIVCAIGVTYGIVEIVAGRFISQRRLRIFTIIASLPRLIFIPYGTLLTIFTLLVLDRASVRLSYRAS